jgi:PAS domain S-box-containing protein
MARKTNSVGAKRALETLLGEEQAGRWARPIVRNWGFLFVGFVFLVLWLPSRDTVTRRQVSLWIIIYTVYLLGLEILCRKAKRLYESAPFQVLRVHFNLLMTAALMSVAPSTTSSYLWFFFSMPLLATLGYFGRLLPLLIVYLEVCASLGVLTFAQGWPTLLDFATMLAQDAILGLLAAVLYFFVHLCPRLREENALLEAANTLIKVLDQRELCQLLADAAKAGVPAAEAAVVHLLGGEDGRTLVPSGSSNIDITTLGRKLMGVGVGIAGHAIRNRERINSPDVSEDGRYLQLPPSFTPFKSLLVAPMYVGDKDVGTISVHSVKKGAFDGRDERFLTMLAAQGAMAIANAELYDTRARRRQQISDILDASRRFGLNQPLDALLEAIATEVRHCSGYRMVVVNLLDEASGEIVVKAMAGVPPAGRRKLAGMHISHDRVMRLLEDDFRISRSYFIRHDRCPEIPDLSQYTFTPDLGERRPGEWHHEDILIVPIETQEEKLVGYLSVDDPSDRQLPSLDTVQALEVLARVAATAIQNARLYEQAQKEIFEREQAEQSLAREQHLLQIFMNNVPDNIYFKDTESRFIRINSALANWFGLSAPPQAIGKTDFDFFTDEHAQQAYADEQDVIGTGQSLSKEEKETWPDGRETWVSTTKMPLRDERGNIIGTFGISKDITKRKQTEDALLQRNRELELLSRVGQAFVSILDLDHVLVRVLEELRRLLGVTAASVWLIEPESGELVCRQAVGSQSGVVHGWRLAPKEGIAGWVVHQGKGLIVPDTRADARYFKGVDKQTGLALRSILGVPMRVKQDVIGVLEVADTEIDRFKPTDLRLVEPLAASAAIAISNARLYEETDRLRAFNENIVQSMEEGILTEDVTGDITFVNRRTAELLGYTCGDLMGRNCTEIVAPEEVAKVREELGKRSQGIASRYETVLLTKGGQRVPVIVSATPILSEGVFTEAVCVYTDITDRKRQETRLREYVSTVTNSLAYHTGLEGLYEFIVEAGAKFLSARDCSLFLVSGDSDTLELVAAMALPLCTDSPRTAISTGPGCGIVAYVAEARQLIRLLGEEIVEHPSYNKELWTRLGWDSDLKADHSLLAAPMCLHDGQLVGVLIARDAESRDGFSQLDEVLLKTLATNAAADIERVRGLERAREDAIRVERKRLETDLHEAMNVLVTGVRWESEIISEALACGDLVAVGVGLTRLRAALTRAYTDLRYLLQDLRDPTLEREGLLVALKKRAELIGHGRIEVRGDLQERLSPEVEGLLYRVGQEAMSNAVKHSAVVRDPDVKVELCLERSDGEVRLWVKDNGVGFDVESTLALTHKWGLRRLRDILKEIGGGLDIDSVPGRGTTICATIDLEVMASSRLLDKEEESWQKP